MSAETIVEELREIKRKVESIEERMITKDELESLMETIELLVENPAILKEIDEAIEEYRKGQYHTCEEVFGNLQSKSKEVH